MSGDPLWGAGKVSLYPRHPTNDAKLSMNEMRRILGELDAFVELPKTRSRSVRLEEGEELVSYAVKRPDGSIDIRSA